MWYIFLQNIGIYWCPLQMYPSTFLHTPTKALNIKNKWENDIKIENKHSSHTTTFFFIKFYPYYSICGLKYGVHINNSNSGSNPKWVMESINGVSASACLTTGFAFAVSFSWFFEFHFFIFYDKLFRQCR